MIRRFINRLLAIFKRGSIMPNMHITINPTSIDKPTGITPGNWRVELVRNGFFIDTYQGPDPTCVFQNVAAGPATLFHDRLDASGQTIGTKVSEPITVPASVPGAEQVLVAGSTTVIYS